MYESQFFFCTRIALRTTCNSTPLLSSSHSFSSMCLRTKAFTVCTFESVKFVCVSCELCTVLYCAFIINEMKIQTRYFTISRLTAWHEDSVSHSLLGSLHFVSMLKIAVLMICLIYCFFFAFLLSRLLLLFVSSCVVIWAVRKYYPSRIEHKTKIETNIRLVPFFFPFICVSYFFFLFFSKLLNVCIFQFESLFTSLSLHISSLEVSVLHQQNRRSILVIF